MIETASWNGNSFWQINYRQGRFDALQALARKSIFAPELTDAPINTGRNGDIIPIPDLLTEECAHLSVPQTDNARLGVASGCQASKTSTELLALEAHIQAPSSSRSPLDECIAQLEASIGFEGASRLGASTKILAELRVGLPIQSSSLIEQSGIARLPSEITKKIISFLEHRRDLSTLSCASKRWRAEAIPALYSTLVLRGWDEIILCLRTVYSSRDIANLVVDLTIDTEQWPKHLDSMFFNTLEKAFDMTRKLRRLVLLLEGDKTLDQYVSHILSQCRFRLHHFVYRGPGSPVCLLGFLDLQTTMRTFQFESRSDSREPFISSLPSSITQVWVSTTGGYGLQPDVLSRLNHLSHLSLRADNSWILVQLRDSPVHYFALDVSPYISSGISPPLPQKFRPEFPGAFLRLRILRLIGYWIICETPSVEVVSLPTGPLAILAGINDIDPPVPGQNHNSGIGQYLNAEEASAVTQDESTLAKTPTLCIEAGLLALLSGITSLQALEVGSFAVRDSGRLRTQVGHAKQWLSLRTRWEEEFIDRIIPHAAKGLVVISFLACDEPLHRSAFKYPPSHHRWDKYINNVRRQIFREDAKSGVTLSGLIARAGLTQWRPPSSEPNNCNYHLNSTFEPFIPSRRCLDEVVTNEWVKAGLNAKWTKRVNVRNLRDIWPPGC